MSFYPYFTDKTDTEELSNLSKVTKLISRHEI